MTCLADRLAREAMTSRVDIDLFDCPVCKTSRFVREDRGTMAKVLTCGAVVMVSFSGFNWLNFDDHKEEK